MITAFGFIFVGRLSNYLFKGSKSILTLKINDLWFYGAISRVKFSENMARPILGNLFLSRVERELLERFH